jgi:diguanylate cyclase (GGDEF)-like protein
MSIVLLKPNLPDRSVKSKMLTRLIVLPLFCVVMLLSFSTTSHAEEIVTANATESTVLQRLIKRADSHIQQTQYEQALELLNKAYENSDSIDDKSVRNDVLNSIANVYYNTGQLEQAYRYYTELVVLDKASKDKTALSISLFNLGHVNASRKQFSKADKNFKASLKISRTLADDVGIASSLKAIGVNAQAQSKLNTAKKYLRESLHLFVAIHDKTQAARVQRHLGDIAFEQHHYDQAIEHYLAALSVLQKQPFSKALMRTHRGLSATYESMANLEQALEHHHRYASLQQQLLEQQNKEVTQRLQVQFETQRFAAENEQLALINQQQEQELKHRQATLKLQYLLIALALVVIVLITALWSRSKKHANAMQLLATRDELTGIQNRRSIMQFAMKEWHRAIRFERPYCCIAIDIDNFKQINDNFGHATGDAVLKQIAESLKSGLRVTDSLGRVGGEEFLLISIESNLLQAHALAERLRSKIEMLQHPHQPNKSITISIGITELNNQVSLEELIAQADEALYQSKNKGRNCVSVYPDLES